jgi:hypothetical protein
MKSAGAILIAVSNVSGRPRIILHIWYQLLVMGLCVQKHKNIAPYRSVLRFRIRYNPYNLRNWIRIRIEVKAGSFQYRYCSFYIFLSVWKVVRLPSFYSLCAISWDLSFILKLLINICLSVPHFWYYFLKLKLKKSSTGFKTCIAVFSGSERCKISPWIHFWVFKLYRSWKRLILVGAELCMWMESSNTVYGRSNNPYHQGRIVGGSSG